MRTRGIVSGARKSAAEPFWTSTFETTELDGWGEWSIVQGIIEGEGPGASHVFVGDAAALGVTPRTGTRAAHFRRPTVADDTPHAKCFVEWNMPGNTKDDYWNRPLKKLDLGGDPSGIYTAWCYNPVGSVVTTGEWSTIVQFKEEGLDAQGVRTQHPSWGLGLSRQSAWPDLPPSDKPIFFVSHRNIDWPNVPWPGEDPELPWVPVPEGRWFEIRVELREGLHSDWYIDGNFLYRALNSTWPVGRMTVTPETWIYGIGYYEGQGTLLFDDCSFRRFP